MSCSILRGWTIALLGASLGLGATAQAAEYTWPGSGACTATLQACIDAAASDDIIDLAPTGPIDESLNVTRSLVLRPLAGALRANGEPLTPPLFAAGRYIAANANTGSAFRFELDGVVLQRGRIFLANNNSAATEFDVRGVTLEAVDTNLFGGIAVVNYVATAPLTAHIENNRVALSANPGNGIPYAGIQIIYPSTNLLASISWNHIDLPAGSPSAIGIYADVAGSSSVAISGNRVRGTTGAAGGGGIRVHNTSASLASGPVQITSNAVSDQDGDATMSAITIETSGGALPASVINNTVVRSGEALQVTGAVSGMVANNIFADAGFVNPGSLSNEYNLLWNIGSFLGTPGAGTVNADPQLDSDLDLRVRWPNASPARDAGNNADLPFFSLDDADQRPRVRNTVVDIGAYETGDLAYQHVASYANIESDWTDLDNAAFNCCDYLPLFATPSMTRETVEPLADSGYVGMYWTGTNWAVFHEDGSNMAAGAAFNVFYPVPVATNRAVTQTVSAANVFGLCMLIDQPDANNHADALLQVTANWNPPGSGGFYDNHPLNIGYNTSQHKWVVCHNDGSAMTNGLSYNIVVTPPITTPNAFIAQASGTVATLPLDHPLLNGNPCAAPQVTAANANLDGQGIKVAVQYFRHGDSGRWAIVPAPTAAGTPANLPASARFHVFVDGAQANACRDDLIFGSGFYQ